MISFIDVAKEKKPVYKVTRPGNHIFFIHNFSGKVVVDIQVAKASCYLLGLYTGRQNDVFELNTVQRHAAPDSFSELLVKGVFYDESKFLYEGLIRIEKEGQHTHAYQKNQNILMSDKCFVDSRPFLEILANDVFCTHGSTTGRLNAEQLYYIKSRGVEEKTAEKLLIEGFTNEIYERIHKLGVKDVRRIQN